MSRRLVVSVSSMDNKRTNFAVAFIYVFVYFMILSSLSHRLVTKDSLEEALAAGDYVTHTGPCGACSSLQDLAAMISTDELPMRGNDCYWSSGGLANIDTARTCYENLGFTPNCARILASYQDRINRRCASICAAFALGQGQSSPACEQSSVCYPCVNVIESRLRLVAGRLDVNSGYPSWSASQCTEIAPLDVVSQGDVCEEAKTAGEGSPVGIMPVAPPSTPMVPFTLVPTSNPSMPAISSSPVPAATKGPTSAPTKRPSAAPTKRPSPAPTKRPTPNPTAVSSPEPTSRTSISANLQRCTELAAVETGLSKRSGGTVVCDCSDDLGSAAPVCYTSPDRTEDQVCAILFGSCNTSSDCCSAGVRGCRLGQCRSASRTAQKSSVRIGSSAGGREVPVDGRLQSEPTGGGTRRRRRIRGTTTSNPRKTI
jgi:hypothetical protein